MIRRLSTTFSLVGHELRTTHRTRSLLVAVLLGGCLVVVAAVLGATLQHRVQTGAGVNYEGSDIVVRSESGSGTGPSTAEAQPDAATRASMSAEDVRAISRLDGVAAADGIVRARAALWAGGKITPTVIESLPSENFRWQRLVDGHYPQTGTEAALSLATMEATGVHLGDVVTMATDEAGDGQFTVVGTVDTRGALDYESTDYAVVTPELAGAFAGTTGANEVRVAVNPGVDAGDVIDEINASVPVGWPDTTSTLITSTESVYRIGLGVLTTMVNGFALITAIVAFTVIGTVVWASLPGRRRQLALMRLVGATRGQLAVVLVTESGLIALVGGLLAIPVGIGLTYLALPALGAVPGVPDIPWSQVIVPVAPLVAVPVVAALGAVLAVAVPAVNAGRVPPADALRRSAGAETVRPASTTLRLLVVVLLALATAVAVLVSGTRVAVVLGVLFFVALIAAVPALCRAGAGLVAKIVGDRYPLAEIGAAEVRSFPGRTAATGMAAMLAAAVMALSWVSLSSVAAVANASSDGDPGPQIMVGAYAGQSALDPVVMQALSDIDGVDGTVPVTLGQVQLSGQPSAGGGAAVRLSKAVVAGDAADFSDLTDGRFPLSASASDTVYLPREGQTPFQDGATVVLTGPKGELPLHVRYINDLPVPGLIAPKVMADLGISTSTQAVWLKARDDADRGGVLDSARTVATIGGDLPVTGTTVTDVKIDSLVDTATRIATAMLAVAVIIAIVGAVVTLTSSLRDRAGEFAVLRLLGMENHQLRRLVGAETVTVGAVSVLIGLVAGVLLGCVASVGLAGVLGVDGRIAVPFFALVVMGVVTVAGLRMAATKPIDSISLVPPATALRDANLGGRP